MQLAHRTQKEQRNGIDVDPCCARVVALCGCAAYGGQVAPVQLSEAQPGHVDVEGAQLAAQAYVDPKAAESPLGFGARGAGLLPVRFVIDNQAHK